MTTVFNIGDRLNCIDISNTTVLNTISVYVVTNVKTEAGGIQTVYLTDTATGLNIGWWRSTRFVYATQQ